MDDAIDSWAMACFIGSFVLMLAGTIAVVFFTDAAIWLKWCLMFVWAFYLAFVGRMLLS